MKATLGGTDTLGIKSIKDFNPNFKTTINSFRIFKNLSLSFWGGEILPFLNDHLHEHIPLHFLRFAPNEK